MPDELKRDWEVFGLNSNFEYDDPPQANTGPSKGDIVKIDCANDLYRISFKGASGDRFKDLRKAAFAYVNKGAMHKQYDMTGIDFYSYLDTHLLRGTDSYLIGTTSLKLKNSPHSTPVIAMFIPIEKPGPRYSFELLLCNLSALPCQDPTAVNPGAPVGARQGGVIHGEP